MTPRFTLTIPAYNEEAYLPRLLDTVDAARAAYRGGADAVEVIVADNCSTDRTAQIARERGCRVARVEKRIIGAARNGGGRAARGEIVCFVDADMLIHPDTFNVIDRALATGRYVGGSTGVLPDRWSAGIRFLWVTVLPLMFLLKMDSGVVFCRREDFEVVGRYREDRLFAEDLAFLFALRRLGKTRGQRLARLIEARAIASTRKFDKYGEWHFFKLPIVALAGAFKSPERQRFARKYWYEDR